VAIKIKIKIMIIKSKSSKELESAINLFENFTGIKFPKIEQEGNLFYSESIKINNELKLINQFFNKYKFLMNSLILQTSLRATRGSY